jgi:hypothetical protein
MNENYHVTTTYWPLTGKFYAGDQSQVPMKAGAQYLKGIASLKAKADGTQELLADGKVALVAKSMQTNPLLAAADPVNLSHLQQIQLIRKPIGEPAKYFALENMFSTLNVDMLQAREAIQSTFTNEGYLAPLEETKANEAKYDEIAYDLKKLTFKVYTPIEDIMRTVINPQTITLNTSQWDLERRRNDQAALELAKITDNNNISAITPIDAGGFHSTNRTASEIATVINDFLEANSSLLTHIALNPADFAEYTENTWTNTGPTNMQFNRVIGAGVAPFPGVSGLTAVIDPKVPVKTAYLVDKINGARLAEGPKITRRYYDEERDAEAIKVSDFNQFKIVIPAVAKVNRKFVTKLTFA